MSRSSRLITLVFIVVLGFATASIAQPAETLPPGAGAASRQAAPILIPVSGQLRDAFNVPRVGPVAIRLALYATLEDLTPLWVEEQVAHLDASGRYVVQLGATEPGGLPPRLFTKEAALWVGVAVAGESEQPRGAVLMAPYAAKALDAEALGGAPASDYLRTDEVMSRVMATLRLLKKEETEVGAGAGGMNFSSLSSTTPNSLAKFLDSDGTVGDSVAFDVAGNVGIGTTGPNYKLDVAGTINSTGSALLRASGSRVIYRDGNALYLGEIDSTSKPVYFRSNGFDAIVLDTSGRVGIGTTGPSYPLDVAGTINSTGTTALRVSGSRVIHRDGAALYLGEIDSTSIPVHLRSNGVDAIVLDTFGNVGVGTASPAARLDVAGNAQVSGNLNLSGAAALGSASVAGTLTAAGATTLTGGASITGALHATGNITAGGSIAAKYQDVAEWVDAIEPLLPGTVVAADPASINKVRRSQRAYDSTVLGVVSTQPGVLLGEAGEGKVAVAQSGRVLVKVDARHGAIKPGDLLVASPTPGYAMLSKPGKNGLHRPGTIIGKALQGLAKGTGEILVLVTLQ